MHQYFRKFFIFLFSFFFANAAFAQSNSTSQQKNVLVAKCGLFTMNAANMLQQRGQLDDYESYRADAFVFFNYLTNKVFKGDQKKSAEFVVSTRPDMDKLYAANKKELETFSFKCLDLLDQLKKVR